MKGNDETSNTNAVVLCDQETAQVLAMLAAGGFDPYRLTSGQLQQIAREMQEHGGN